MSFLLDQCISTSWNLDKSWKTFLTSCPAKRTTQTVSPSPSSSRVKSLFCCFVGFGATACISKCTGSSSFCCSTSFTADSGCSSGSDGCESSMLDSSSSLSEYDRVALKLAILATIASSFWYFSFCAGSDVVSSDGNESVLLLVSVQQLESSNGDEPDCWSDGADTTTCCGSVLGGSWLGDGTGVKPCCSAMLSVVASACVSGMCACSCLFPAGCWVVDPFWFVWCSCSSEVDVLGMLACACCSSDGAGAATCCGSALGGSWLGDGTGVKPCCSAMLSVVASACVSGMCACSCLFPAGCWVVDPFWFVWCSCSSEVDVLGMLACACCWSDGADATTCCGSAIGGSWLGGGTGGKPCGSSMLSVVASACVSVMCHCSSLFPAGCWVSGDALFECFSKNNLMLAFVVSIGVATCWAAGFASNFFGWCNGCVLHLSKNAFTFVAVVIIPPLGTLSTITIFFTFDGSEWSSCCPGESTLLLSSAFSINKLKCPYTFPASGFSW